MPKKFEARYMAGKCASGAQRDTGPRWHAVPEGAFHTHQALCGRSPAIQWSDPRPIEERPVTCPSCLRRLKRLARETP